MKNIMKMTLAMILMTACGSEPPIKTDQNVLEQDPIEIDEVESEILTCYVTAGMPPESTCGIQPSCSTRGTYSQTCMGKAEELLSNRIRFHCAKPWTPGPFANCNDCDSTLNPPVNPMIENWQYKNDFIDTYCFVTGGIPADCEGYADERAACRAGCAVYTNGTLQQGNITWNEPEYSQCKADCNAFVFTQNY